MSNNIAHALAIWMGATTRLAVSSCPIFAAKPVLPSKNFCIAPTSAWLTGADTKKPYSAIWKAFGVTFVRAKICETMDASLDTL